MSMLTEAPALQVKEHLQGGHCYGLDRSGKPHSIAYVIGKSTGRVRAITIRDLRTANEKKPLIAVNENGENPVEIVHAMHSITTLLRLLDKPALRDWKDRQIIDACLTFPKGDEEPVEAYYDRIRALADRKMATAADLGSGGHDAIEKALRGEAVDAKFEPLIRGVLEKMQEHGVTVTETEFICYSRHYGIAGRCDGKGVKGDKRIYVDYKFRNTPNSYPTDSIQLAAYVVADQSAVHGMNCKGIRQYDLSACSAANFIIDSKTGECEFVEHSPETLQTAFAAWRGLVSIYTHEKGFDPTK